jgi:hypothetical protein
MIARRKRSGFFVAVTAEPQGKAGKGTALWVNFSGHQNGSNK